MDDVRIMLTAVYDRLALSIESGVAEDDVDDVADIAVMLTTVGKRLRHTVETAPEPQPAASDEIIPVTVAGITTMVRRSSIRWVEAQGDYARLHTGEGSYLVRVPLAQLEARWASAGFLRIHRSFIIFLPSITEVHTTESGYLIRIGTGSNAPLLPVSRRYGRRLRDQLHAMRLDRKASNNPPKN